MKTPSPADLAPSYTDLFTRCAALPDREAEVAAVCARIAGHRETYEGVAAPFGNGLPWFGIALIHAMEADLDFSCHLHNGDPLRRRTQNEPAGRPKGGTPPFAWEVSARDALQYDGWDRVPAERWQSVAGLLYQLEAYNGWGSRLYHNVPTPYLWSASNIEVPGKYVADGKWSETARSAQIGAAVLLKHLVASGIAVFTAESVPASTPTSAPATAVA